MPEGVPQSELWAVSQILADGLSKTVGIRKDLIAGD